MKSGKLTLNESEKESMIRVVSEAIKHLKAYGSLDEFTHLTNLIYVYKNLTGENYKEDQQHENSNV